MQWSGQDGLGDQPDVFPASKNVTATLAAGMHFHQPTKLYHTQNADMGF